MRGEPCGAGWAEAYGDPAMSAPRIAAAAASRDFEGLALRVMLVFSAKIRPSLRETLKREQGYMSSEYG